MPTTDIHQSWAPRAEAMDLKLQNLIHLLRQFTMPASVRYRRLDVIGSYFNASTSSPWRRMGEICVRMDRDWINRIHEPRWSSQSQVPSRGVVVWEMHIEDLRGSRHHQPFAHEERQSRFTCVKTSWDSGKSRDTVGFMLESSYELAGIAIWVGDGIRWNPRFLSGYESFGAELCQSASSVVEHGGGWRKRGLLFCTKQRVIAFRSRYVMDLQIGISTGTLSVSEHMGFLFGD